MTKKEKFDDLSTNILELIGGKDNISYFVHCLTRLRFVFKDKSLIDIESIEKLSGVIGTQWQGDQFQIIIGQSVVDVYDLICEKAGIEISRQSSDGAEKKRKFSIGLIFETIAGCIIPVFPLLLGTGMIKVILLLANMTGLLSDTNSTYIVFNFAADAGLYFLPIFVGYAAATKFKVSPALGMLIGAIIISPTFLEMVAGGEKLNIFGIPVFMGKYTSTIFPSIIAVFLMKYVENFFSKRLPAALKTIGVPLLTLLIMIPATLCAIAPLGNFLGVYLSNAIMWLYNNVGFVGVAIYAALRPFIVMTGMHVALTPHIVNSMATLGYEPFAAISGVIANMNQGAACLAVGVKSKNSDIKSTSISCAATAMLGGVLEPAMYGINLKYKTPMIAAVIGNFVGAAYAGIAHVYMRTFVTNGGIFGITAFMSNNKMDLINAIISILIGIVVTFLVTLVIFKEKKEN